MSTQDAELTAQKFQQANAKAASTSQGQKHDQLHAQYKPVGISAVTAAAHYTEKSQKKAKQKT